MSSRANPAAVPRKRVSLASWLLVAGLALATLPTVRAQGVTPAPLPPKTAETGPTVASPPDGRIPRGVIRPPAHVDPAMPRVKPNPDKYTMPVIPPPGAPGGNPTVKPK